MQREQEIKKMINVLRQTARMASQAERSKSDLDVAAFCLARYNRVLARLSEIEPGVATVFAPLAAESSLGVVALASRQLIAYCEGESDPYPDPVASSECGKEAAAAFSPRGIKLVWPKTASDFQVLNYLVRDLIDKWSSRQPKGDQHHT
jgi:hypothetical protein